MHQLIREQQLNISLEEAWEFFSSPANLEKITPKDMSFVIKTKNLGKMYPGQIIQYTVSPLLGIPMRWVTEITHVAEPQYFVDEQRVGPYSIWHHEHHFVPNENGVLMTDILYYQLPLGIVGRLLNSIFIGKRVKDIFDYRYEFLERYFNHNN